MALALSASIVDKQNVLLTLNGDNTGAVVRIAALTTDYLVTLTAVGAKDLITWTLFLGPSWLTVEPSTTDPAVAKIKFTNPSADIRMFQCYVQADDGVTKARYPISIEVLEPLSVTVSGRTDNYMAYDSASDPVTLQARGLHDLKITDGSVQFITPVGLPSGLLFATGDGGTATLRVAQPNPNSTSGGVVFSAPTTYDFLAYRPGSMYDSLTHPYKQSITIGTLDKQKGVLDTGLTCAWDDTNGFFKLNILPDYLGGIGDDLNYVWVTTLTDSGTGTTTAGGGLTNTFMEWTPTHAGTVQFDLVIKNAATNVVMKALTIGPLAFSTGFPSSSGDWSATPAIKLQVDAAYKSGHIGDVIPFIITIPPEEFSGPETITVSFAITPVGSEPVISNPAPYTMAVGTNTRTINLTVPTGSPFKGKWKIVVSAINGATSRTGLLNATLLSSGQPLVKINNGALITLSQTTGNSIQPISLVATKGSTLDVISDEVFYLLEAPAGLTIADNKIIGSVPQEGSFNFRVMGLHPSLYAPSFSEASVVVTGSDAPLTVTNFSSAVSEIQDATQFQINWGITGNPKTLTLQKNLEWPAVPVLGAVQSTQTIVGTSVFTLVGTDYRTKVYSKPLIVVSSSTAGLTRLPGSPAIATIDKNNSLKVQWNPASISDGYSLYRGWNIQTSKNGEPAVYNVDPATGQAPTGLVDPAAKVDSRIFTTQLQSADYTMSMTPLSSNLNSILNGLPWPSFLAFPSKLDPSTVVVDKTSLKLEETLTVQLSQVYGDADYWRVTFSDATNTGWLPISQKTQSKIFHTPGPQSALVEFERDFSTQVPPVRLRRSTLLNIYVQNEVYNSSTTSLVGIGNVGLGGEAGFEIADLSKDSFAREPYEVVVKTLVKDDITQELKMLVATSRSNNASSILNTMSADVFPLVGRPHLKDLIIPAPNLLGDTHLISSVSITTTALPDVYVGRPMPEVQLYAIGGTEPYDWYSDSLPFGLKLAVDGTLSGTPLQIGVYNINIAVKDSTVPAYISEATVTMTIKSGLTVDLTPPPDATVGTYYQFQLISSGGLSPYYWSLADGAIPLGLTLDPSSGVVSGYPVSYNSDPDFDTPFSFVAEVVDSVGSRASGDFNLNLLPMALTLGNVDQPVITKGLDYKLALPVFGGRSPYSVTAFSSDGSIGNNLSIIAPETVDAVSGLGTAVLTIMTGDQVFSPAVYPYQATFPLSAVGGIAPYTWSLDTTNPSVNTVTSPAVSAATAAGQFSANGVQTMNVHVTDASGNAVSKVIRMTSTLNGVGVSASLQYVTINKNSSTDITAWTFTKISSLPDAQQGASYRPSPSTFYGVAVWDPGTDLIYDHRLRDTQIQFKYLYSRVGGSGQSASSKFVMDARPADMGIHAATYGPYNTIIQGVFSSSGVVDSVTGRPYPPTFYQIYDPVINLHLPNVPADQQTYTWSYGSRTTVPDSYKPHWSGVNTAGAPVTGLALAGVTTATGTVTLTVAPASEDPGLYGPAASIVSTPWILEIVAQDGSGNTYKSIFNYYRSSGNYLTASSGADRTYVQLTFNVGYAPVWVGLDTLITNYNAAGLGGGPNNATFLGNAVAIATNTSGTVSVTAGGTTPYFPMGVNFYQGDAVGKTHIQMLAGDVYALAPLPGYSTTSVGANPYSFVILNDTSTPDANAKINTVGGYTIGTVITDNDLSKEMSLHCSVPGGGNTPVVTVTSTHGDVLDVSALGYRYRRILRAPVTTVGLGYTNDAGIGGEITQLVPVTNTVNNYYYDAVVDTGYVNWYYILNASGGTAPYTFSIQDGTTLPGVTVHNAQTTATFLNADGSQTAVNPYQGCFLLINQLPEAVVYSLYNTLDYVVKITATDAVGNTSIVSTIPFRVVPQTTGVITASLGGVASSVLQPVSQMMPGGTFYTGRAVDSLNQAITLNTAATWSIDTALPTGLSLSNRGSGSLNDSLGTVYGNTVQLVGTPTTATTVTVALTATAPGYAPQTFTVPIITKDPVATITVLNNGVARPNTNYSITQGSPLVQLSLEGFLPTDAAALTTNLGTLGQATIMNVAPIQSADYAQSFDVFYDYHSGGVAAGTGTLTLTGAPVPATADFSVEPHNLVATGKVVSFTVSEYQSGGYSVTVPPVVITGGVTPYGAVCTAVSDTTHFSVVANQPFLNMATVTPGNTYTTNATYRVADSTTPSQTIDAVATVSVYIQPETFINVQFVNNSHTFETGKAVTYSPVELIHAQLGHVPFQWKITSVTLSDVGMSDWVKFSPTNRNVVVNHSAADVVYKDYADVDVITTMWNGAVTVSGRTGPNFTVPKFTVPPTTGSYTITFGITVIDVRGISKSGTAVMALIVP